MIVEQQPLEQDLSLRQNDERVSRLLNRVVSRGNLAVKGRIYSTNGTIDLDTTIVYAGTGVTTLTLPLSTSWSNDNSTDRRSPFLTIIVDQNVTLTLNTTSPDAFYLLNGSTSLTLLPNDILELVTLGNSVWYVASYQPAVIGSSSSHAPRNLIINGTFAVNQRAYVSAAVLAAGKYGHDRWKAGASGGDYTFVQRADGASASCAAGKTLIQIIEDKNVVGGTYILSWTGAAHARVGINTAVPAGSFTTSPIILTGQTAGTTMSVEFDSNGAFSNVQLEHGAVLTPYEDKLYPIELLACQRYYRRINASAGTSAFFASGMTTSTSAAVFAASPASTGMRVLPTTGFSAGVGDLFVFQSGGNTTLTSLTIQNPADFPSFSAGTAAVMTANVAALLLVGAGAGKFLELSAEL
jgi:hypothetical protein